MLIDWFTIIAQALNFLILVWLLKRFLYKPILNAIDTREKRISTELSNADAKRAEAQKEKEDFKRKNEEFDQQRATLLNKAKDEAEAERQRLLEEVRKEASNLKLKQEEALRNEKQNLNQEIRRRTVQEVFSIARKMLTDLAGVSLEEHIVDVFVRRLHELKGEEKERLESALEEASAPILIRTAFDLPQAQHTIIEKEIKETFGAEIKVRFETVPDLISGIELRTNGQKVAWSVSDYLTSLEKSIDELLKSSRDEIGSGPEESGMKPESDTNSDKSENDFKLKAAPK